MLPPWQSGSSVAASAAPVRLSVRRAPCLSAAAAALLVKVRAPSCSSSKVPRLCCITSCLMVACHRWSRLFQRTPTNVDVPRCAAGAFFRRPDATAGGQARLSDANRLAHFQSHRRGPLADAPPRSQVALRGPAPCGSAAAAAAALPPATGPAGVHGVRADAACGSGRPRPASELIASSSLTSSVLISASVSCIQALGGAGRRPRRQRGAATDSVCYERSETAAGFSAEDLKRAEERWRDQGSPKGLTSD